MEQKTKIKMETQIKTKTKNKIETKIEIKIKNLDSEPNKCMWKDYALNKLENSNVYDMSTNQKYCIIHCEGNDNSCKFYISLKNKIKNNTNVFESNLEKELKSKICICKNSSLEKLVTGSVIDLENNQKNCTNCHNRNQHNPYNNIKTKN